MPRRTLPRIVAVAPGEQPMTLCVRWDKDGESLIDVSRMIQTFRVYGPLRDSPELFRQVRVGEYGTDVVWTHEIDMAADTLWRLAQEQAGETMTPDAFRHWREHKAYTLEQAARALGLSRRMVAYYEKGDRPIPRVVALATRALDTTSAKRQGISMPINMQTSLRPDLARASQISEKLCDAFYNSQTGIHGETLTTSWQTNCPSGMKTRSREQLLFIALTSSVDRQRQGGSIELWARRAKPAYEASHDYYLFDPEKVVQAGFDKVYADLKRLGISQKHRPDATAWYSICEAFADKWDGDPQKFLESCYYHAPTLLARLKKDRHPTRLNGRQVRDYPQLRGPKIGPMFLRLLRDWAQVELTDMDEVPIPVDSQVLKATLCTGVLRGRYEGPEGPLFSDVRSIWREAVKGLTNKATGRPMIGLDMDGPLWRVGRYWCAAGSKAGCPCAPNCGVGAMIGNSKGRCRINTKR